MGMQDVDFELVYQPGKDEADPLHFLSRHPLLETGTDSVKKVICQVISSEHAVVLEHIHDETRKDAKLQELAERISRGDWEQYRKDPDIAPFHTIRYELYSVNDLIFTLNQTVILTRLQRKVVRAAHHIGHLGTTKTKQMLREKYWFPTMNTMSKSLDNVSSVK